MKSDDLKNRTKGFVSKMGMVEEESDESMYWLELLAQAGLANGHDLSGLLKEAELTAIFTASGKTAKRSDRVTNPQSPIRNRKSD